ncbi:HEAT repeat domain-containing protein [Desulfuromonas sp. AOP6]|uniref:HEAT repeat domain-containing protein n=1 Tax=Desulfuromonas sp. AOP6 TaxID=1566351 RepID=UPI0012730F64|nr:HEAT repeat domain-containing protein [Desulfuromonas sp. AOP6]BCA80015.1 PBS lyase [Desulfuromonas sp. AOP6]
MHSEVTPKDIQRNLDSSLEEERLGGLRALRVSCGEEWLPLLYRAMGDSSWRVRKEAVEIFLALPGAIDHISGVVSLLYADDNAGARNAAVEILTRLGRQSLPCLFAEMECEDRDVRKFILDILGEIRDTSAVPLMIEALSDNDGNIRAAAAENLGKIGSVAAVSPLLDLMEEADLLLRFTILQALGQIGAEVPVESLLKWSREPLLRKALYDCLGQLGGIEVAEELVQGLFDDKINVRHSALLALEKVERRHPGELTARLPAPIRKNLAEALGLLLEDGPDRVRRAALLLIGVLKDEQAAFQLLPLLAEESLREAATKALISMGRKAAASLMDHWQSVEAYQRPYLAYVVGMTGCVEGLNHLLSALQSEDADLRAVSAQALGVLGVEKAVSPLVSLLDDKSDTVRSAALEALATLGGKYPERVYGALQKLLGAEDFHLRTCALSIISRLDVPAAESALVFALKDETPQVRQAAVKALGKCCSSRHHDALLLALTDEDPEVRRMAVDVFARSVGPDAFEPLSLAVQDEDLWVRVSAIRGLGATDCPAAWSLLTHSLNDPVGLVVIAALETLAEQDLDQATLFLVEALSHPDPEVVTASLKILAAAGRQREIESAQPCLCQHAASEVRLAYARVLVEDAGDQALAVLREMNRQESDELVRRQLDVLLEDVARGNI